MGMTLEEAVAAIYVDHDGDGCVEWRDMDRRGRNNYTKLANSELRAAYRRKFPEAKTFFAEMDKEFSMIPDTEPYVATGIFSPYGTNERDHPSHFSYEEAWFRAGMDSRLKALEMKARKERFLPTGTPQKVRDAHAAIRKGVRKSGIGVDLKERFRELLDEDVFLDVLHGLHGAYAGFDARPIREARVFFGLVNEVLDIYGKAYEKGSV